jgi:hypothetical protein
MKPRGGRRRVSTPVHQMEQASRGHRDGLHRSVRRSLRASRDNWPRFRPSLTDLLITLGGTLFRADSGQGGGAVNTHFVRSRRQRTRFQSARALIDPVSRVGLYPSEVIVRLGLIEIARIHCAYGSRHIRTRSATSNCVIQSVGKCVCSSLIGRILQSSQRTMRLSPPESSLRDRPLSGRIASSRRKKAVYTKLIWF